MCGGCGWVSRGKKEVSGKRGQKEGSIVRHVGSSICIVQVEGMATCEHEHY